jgi:hypothetical protein
MIFTAATFLSCKKTSLNESEDMPNLSQAVKQSINAGFLVAIKQSYSLLNANDKQILWDTKWDAILKNDAERLTSEKVKIISLIKDFVDGKTISSL